MSTPTSALRRILVLALIGAMVVAIRSWLRDRNGPTPDPTLPETPPTSPVQSRLTPAEAPAPERSKANVDDSGPSATTTPTVDGPKWVLPNDDGTAPETHPIKANERSGIYHVPGGSFYSRTNPERCYAIAADAEADGYRRAKS